MPKIIAFPTFHAEQNVSEAQALVRLMISIGENAEDQEFSRLKPSLVCSLYVLCDKLDKALKQMPVRREAM